MLLQMTSVNVEVNYIVEYASQTYSIAQFFAKLMTLVSVYIDVKNNH